MAGCKKTSAGVASKAGKALKDGRSSARTFHRDNQNIHIRKNN